MIVIIIIINRQSSIIIIIITFRVEQSSYVADPFSYVES